MNERRVRTSHRWIQWGAWLFPIVVWALATMLLRGDLGRWNDDYAFNQRVPETGVAHQWHPSMVGIFTLSQQFWRPLFFVIIPTLQTALWDTPWVNHALQAVLHLGLCVLVWRLLLRLKISRWTAASVTLVYMTFPVHFQTLFWSACLTTILATGIYMVLVLMYLRYSELPPGRAGSWGRILAWTGAMTVVGTLIPLVNEQPAAAVIALPFLHPALRLRRDPGRGSRVADVSRALLPIAALLVMYAGYLYLYVTTSRKGYPATAGTFIDLHPRAFFARAPWFLQEMWLCVSIGGRWDELFRAGARTIRGLKSEAWAWAVFAGLTGLSWAWYWFRAGSGKVVPTRSANGGSNDADAAKNAPMHGGILVFGLAAWTSAWGVVYVLRVYAPEPRLFFMPLVGALAILGVVVDRLRARLARHGPLTARAARVAGVMVVPAAVGGAIVLVGAQSVYREVFYRDEGLGEQLRSLVPEPQREGFLVPVRVEDARYRVGDDWFNRQFHQIFLSSYNTNAWVKQQMRHSRATAGTYDRGRSEYKLVDEESLGWAWKFVPEGTPSIPGGRWGVENLWLVPWSKVVPFKIDAQGKIRLVTEIAIHRADNRDGRVKLDMVAEIAKSRAVPEEVATFYNPSADARVVPVGPWKWAGGAAAPFWRQFEWDMEYTATRLIAGTASDRAAARLFAVLPPSEKPTRVYFRAALSRANTGPDQPDLQLRWMLGGANEPAATLDLSPAVMLAQQRWIPVTFEVPPHGSALAIEASVEYKSPSDRPGGPPATGAHVQAREVFAFVTEGFWEPVTPTAPIAPSTPESVPPSS